MEKFSELISILLQHSQRFLDFWNFQIIIILGVLGFAFSNQETMAKRSIRFLISFVFICVHFHCGIQRLLALGAPGTRRKTVDCTRIPRSCGAGQLHARS